MENSAKFSIFFPRDLGGEKRRKKRRLADENFAKFFQMGIFLSSEGQNKI